MFKLCIIIISIIISIIITIVVIIIVIEASPASPSLTVLRIVLYALIRRQLNHIQYIVTRAHIASVIQYLFYISNHFAERIMGFCNFAIELIANQDTSSIAPMGTAVTHYKLVFVFRD